jgi:hypothetical protein
MRSEEGAELQTRHEAFSRLCVALIPIDRAWSTRRMKNSENRDFCPRSWFPAKNQSLPQMFRDQIRYYPAEKGGSTAKRLTSVVRPHPVERMLRLLYSNSHDRSFP